VAGKKGKRNDKKAGDRVRSLEAERLKRIANSIASANKREHTTAPHPEHFINGMDNRC
jgi:hypothetical protein